MATNKVLIDVKERGSKKAAGKLKNLGSSLKGVIGPAAALGAAFIAIFPIIFATALKPATILVLSGKG